MTGLFSEDVSPYFRRDLRTSFPGRYSVTTGAYAMDSLLWIKIPKSIADAFLADRLMAEQLIKVWMKGWKQESGRQTVTIYVEWGDVEIARGETTIFSGDKITIKR